MQIEQARQRLEQERVQSERTLIGLDAELALLERMAAESAPALALVPPPVESVS